MKNIIFWFRQDLRLEDNPALIQAAQNGQVLPIYILAPNNDMGAASRVWLHHSLKQLSSALHGNLNLYRGDAQNILNDLRRKFKADTIYCNQTFTPWQDAQDKQLNVTSFNASLLWQPWQILKSDQTPYKVFTPYYKACLAHSSPRKPLPDAQVNALKDSESLDLQNLELLPKNNWDKSVMDYWQAGSKTAQKRLEFFLQNSLQFYKQGRDFPARKDVSRLSPHLHFGEISPHQIWQATQAQGFSGGAEHFLRELCWREFSYYLLHHFPTLSTQNFNKKFDAFPWKTNDKNLRAWQRGQTGIPIIDAGMRELWQTGWMHNRVRMIVGSFLVKNLLIDWRKGAEWFWDCLFDADLANNSASWQWVAGSGADAAPYFRIFNPVTQGEKFDADGLYTRRFVPELAKLPSQYLFAPWTAPQEVLVQSGIIIGKTYPAPIVDLKESRALALNAYHQLSITD